MTQSNVNNVAVGVLVLVGIAAIASLGYITVLSRRGTKKYLESL